MSGTKETKGAKGAMGTKAERSIMCGYCGVPFREERGQAACRSCPLGDACRYVRCPACGYENPVEPHWLTGLRRLVTR